MKSNAPAMIALMMAGLSSNIYTKEDVIIERIPKRIIVPKGANYYQFLSETDIRVNEFLSKDRFDLIFECTARTEKAAISKFKRYNERI